MTVAASFVSDHGEERSAWKKEWNRDNKRSVWVINKAAHASKGSSYFLNDEFSKNKGIGGKLSNGEDLYFADLFCMEEV